VTFFTALPLFMFFIKQCTSILRNIIFIIFSIIILIFFQNIYEALISVLVPGRSSLFDIFETELAGDTERPARMIEAINEIVPNILFCVDCSEKMSYSSLVNFFALCFPFSMYYIAIVIKGFFSGFFMLISPRLTMFYRLILPIIFFCTLLQVVFQADFLSLLSFFYVISLACIMEKNSSFIDKKIN
jgi:hypothetical protein